MSQITKGRKKAPISYLFNDVNKKGMKVDRVTCRYCHIEIAKNGTRMAAHIKKMWKYGRVSKGKIFRGELEGYRERKHKPRGEDQWKMWEGKEENSSKRSTYPEKSDPREKPG